MENSDSAYQVSRSSLVTVVAWISIVLSGFSTFVGLLQNIMLTLFFPVKEMQNAMQAEGSAQNIPAFAQFIFAHFQWVFLIVLLLSVFILVSSIALLKRKNWARVVFISFFAFSILWNIGGVFIQAFFFSSATGVVPQAPAGFQTMATVMLVFSCAMAIGFSILSGWLIWRFRSDAICAEFGVGAH